jgi:hypothetical protein
MVKADLVVGGPQSVVIEAAHGEDLDDVRYQVVNGKLDVWIERDFWDIVSFRDRQVTVTITTPSLDALEASAGSEVSAKGVAGETVRISASGTASIAVDEIVAGDIDVEVSSNSRVALSGTCEMIEADVSSTALVNARDLVCLTADIAASSASQSVFHVTGDVVADVSSAAQVVLVGDPDHVDDEESSAGEITVLD